MSKNLEERLQDARSTLGKIDAAIVRNSGKLAGDVETQFSSIAAFASDIEHWKHLIFARKTARMLLEDLEKHADENDNVPYGAARARFQVVRLLGLQSYLSAQWSLADRIVGMSGQILCIRSCLQDPKTSPQLLQHFVASKGAESKTAAIACHSLRQSFGWPIAISYALRNYFLHDGAGTDFFSGPNAASAFNISESGWSRIEGRVREHNVSSAQSRRAGTWNPSAGDDLRAVLDVCAEEIDEALGVLVGSASQTAMVHVGFMLGED